MSVKGISKLLEGENTNRKDRRYKYFSLICFYPIFWMSLPFKLNVCFVKMTFGTYRFRDNKPMRGMNMCRSI